MLETKLASFPAKKDGPCDECPAHKAKGKTNPKKGLLRRKFLRIFIPVRQGMAPAQQGFSITNS